MSREQLQRRHAQGSRRDPLGHEPFVSAEDELDFGAARHEDNRRLAALAALTLVRQHVGAEPQAVRRGVSRAVDHRDLLSREHERDRSVPVQDRDAPRFDHFGGVRRPDDGEPRNRAEAGELLDRLVRGPVLAQPDGVVREHVDRRQAGQGGEPDRRPHVLREDEERRADGPHAAVQRQAAEDGAHRVLAHTEMDVPPPPVPRRDVAAVLEDHIGRARQVRRAADQFGEPRRDRVEHLARRGAGRLEVLGREGRQLGVPALGEPTREPALELGREVGVRRAVAVVALLPLGLEPGAALHRAPPVRQRIRGHVERLETRPAEVLLRELHLVLPERRTVGLGCVLLVGATKGDVRADDDEGRAIGDAPGRGERRVERAQVVPVRHPRHVPAVGFEPLGGIVRERQVGGAVDGDAIIVVDPDQAVELQVAGERAGLVGGALHQVAVRGEEVRVMIDDGVAPSPVELRGEVRPGERHADGVAHALAERPRSGLDAGRETVLRVARRAAAPLAKLLQVLEREVVSCEVEHRVQQHAGVADREHEAVAPEPVGVGRIVAEMALPQHVRERRERHRGTGVAGVRSLHRVHREGADGVDAELVERRVARRGGSGRARAWGHSSPDFAACHRFTSRSKPLTSTSTCCGLGVARAAVLSSSQIFGIS